MKVKEYCQHRISHGSGRAGSSGSRLREAAFSDGSTKVLTHSVASALHSSPTVPPTPGPGMSDCCSLRRVRKVRQSMRVVYLRCPFGRERNPPVCRLLGLVIRTLVAVC